MPTFEEYASQGRIMQLEPDMVPKCKVVRPEDFQYAKCGKPITDVFFSCWFTTKDGIVEDSDACIHMAEPSTGQFVFYEIKGVMIDLRHVNGCKMQFRQDGKIIGEGTFAFGGLKGMPIRCVIPGDFMTSRVYVQFVTQQELAERSLNASLPEREKALNIIDIIKGNKQ